MIQVKCAQTVGRYSARIGSLVVLHHFSVSIRCSYSLRLDRLKPDRPAFSTSELYHDWK